MLQFTMNDVPVYDVNIFPLKKYVLKIKKDFLVELNTKRQIVLIKWLKSTLMEEGMFWANVKSQFSFHNIWQRPRLT